MVKVVAQGGGGDWMQRANDISGIASSFAAIATEGANAYTRGQFRSATSWTGWNSLRNSQQAWRTANVLGKTGAATLSIAGKAVGVLGGLSAAYSTYKVYNQYKTGGVSNIDGWDFADATIGGAGTISTRRLRYAVNIS